MRNQGLALLLLASLSTGITLQSCKKSEPAAPSKQGSKLSCCGILDPIGSKPLLLLEKDNGSSIMVKHGQTVMISLRSNPTTGFNWFLHPLPEFLMTEDNPSYEPESKQIGSGGLWTLKIRAIGTGNGVVTIDYKRSFEVDKEPAKQFTINIESK